MNGDQSLKDNSINLRCTKNEKARVQRLADTFTGGDISALQRQLFTATENAINTHGSRTIWPPVLNYYPPDTKTQQDINTPRSGDSEK